MKLYDKDNKIVMATACKTPRRSGRGRSWDYVPWLIDGVEVKAHIDTTFGRRFYFSLNNKCYAVSLSDNSDLFDNYKSKLFTKKVPK